MQVCTEIEKDSQRQMHCLLAVSLTQVCLRPAFINLLEWTKYNICCSFQHVKSQPQASMNETNRKQTVHLVFGVLSLIHQSSFISLYFVQQVWVCRRFDHSCAAWRLSQQTFWRLMMNMKAIAYMVIGAVVCAALLYMYIFFYYQFIPTCTTWTLM